MQRTLLPSILILAAAPTAAFAQAIGTQVDEPANLALFGLGIVGLLVGRHAAKRKD